ncbi:MAG: hypothetical protein UZ07_CHB004002547 [Chlorobi bacterium OLB7]|nr:MAG: hypothetical protein UZ07_CHB004002547 [Chlorobi bacterium OLB7]
MKSCCIVCFCLFFAGMAAATAQPGDVRLSPEPVITTLPDDIHIQSAAAIGNTTLAVWGTVIANGDSAVRRVLWSQIIHGTEPQEGKALTDTTANPLDIVSVHSLDDRFLVVWNERRGGVKRTYLCVVDTTGNVIIPAQQVSTITAIDDRSTWLLRGASGYLFLYRENHGGYGLQAISLNTDGSLAQAPWTILKDGVLRVTVNSHSPHLAIISTQTGGKIIYADGTIDSGIIPSNRMNAAHTIRPDSSLYCIIKDTLYKFNNYFDADAEWKRQIQLRDGIAGTQVIIPHENDSSISIFYAAHTEIQIDSKSYTDEIRQYKIDLTNNTDTIITTTSYTVPLPKINSIPDNGYVEKWIDQVYRINIVYKAYVIANREIYTYAVVHMIAMIDSAGISSPVIATKDSVLPTLRVSSSAVDAVRTSFIDSSTIVLLEKKMQLRAPMDSYYKNINQNQPILTLVNGELIATYTEGDYPKTLRNFELLTTNGGLSDSMIFLPKLSSTGTPPKDQYTFRQHQIHRNVGQGMLVEFDNRHRPREPHSGDFQEATVSTFRFFLPSDTGWRIIGDIESVYIDKEKKPTYIRYTATSSIVDRQWGIGTTGAMQAFGKDYEMEHIVYAVDSQANNISTIINTPYTGIHPIDDSVQAIIPIDSHSFFVIFRSSITKYRDSLALFSKSFQWHPYSTYCLAANKTFLRYYHPDPANIIIESYDTTLQRQAWAKIPILQRFPHFAFVQNPTDNSISIVQGLDSGIVITMLDTDLRPYRDTATGSEVINVPISSGRMLSRFVSGVFRNDTLFFVWEGQGKDATDIYGNIWVKSASMIPPPMKGPTLPDPPTPTKLSSTAVRSVVPNPATDRLTIDFSVVEDATIEFQIINILGQPIRRWSEHRQAGDFQSVVSLEGMAAGYYFLFVENAPDGNTIFPFIALGAQ